MLAGGNQDPASLPSTYLAYLPSPYQGDDFLRRFLLIFEGIHGPIERTIDQLACYFDPRVAPVEMLPWLASWVGMQLDENWPVQKRRQLILWAATLYRWRGTRRGMREHLRLYTGLAPLITENFDGLRLGDDTALGENTRMGQPRQHWLTIVVRSEDPEKLEERVLRQIVEFQKPAHVGYTLSIQHTAGASHDAGQD